MLKSLGQFPVFYVRPTTFFLFFDIIFMIRYIPHNISIITKKELKIFFPNLLKEEYGEQITIVKFQEFLLSVSWSV